MSQYVVGRIQEKFGAAVLSTHASQGDDTVVIERGVLLDLLFFLRDDVELAFNLPIDLTVVDWYRLRELRFEVVYHLLSTTKRHRIRIKVPLVEDDLKLDSSFPVWPGLDWFEREAWDLYGVTFEGHPNHKRILMWEGFEGHPLRKDYPINQRQPVTALLGEKA